MGIGGISIVQLLIIFAIILLIFGGKRLRNLGSDLGTTIKGFKKAMSEEESKKIDSGSNTLEKNASNPSTEPEEESVKKSDK